MSPRGHLLKSEMLFLPFSTPVLKVVIYVQTYRRVLKHIWIMETAGAEEITEEKRKKTNSKNHEIESMCFIDNLF